MVLCQMKQKAYLFGAINLNMPTCQIWRYGARVQSEIRPGGQRTRTFFLKMYVKMVLKSLLLKVCGSGILVNICDKYKLRNTYERGYASI